MISKLPPWVWSCAWALAFVAGMINVVGLLGFEKQAVTHLSGVTTMMGAALGEGDGAAFLHYLALLLSFVGGTVLSALIVQDSTLRLGRRYGWALMIESLLLCASVPLLWRHQHAGMCVAACACGLQNAMASTYSGSVVRTTHVSGMFTDLGIFLGHYLRGIPVDGRRLRLCVVIISAFATGGVAGTLAFHHLGYSTLLIPAALTGLASLAHALFLRTMRG
ncbi:MAG: hypothetical protein JWO08_2741 [Verrucomicrobiaceae bacterium]|nr:hypothetical protein [Verrucomicrobiaceae bacterium]